MQIAQQLSETKAEIDTTDSVLLERVRQRDQESFACLYDRHSSLVYAIALRLLGDQTGAETIVMEVFADLWQMTERFPVSVTMTSALLTVTRTRIRLRQKQNNKNFDVRELSGDDREPNLASSATSERMSGLEHGIAVRALPSKQREVIELAYYNQLRRTEIASRLDLPSHTVHTNLRQGLLTLHQHLFPDKHSLP